MTERTKIRPKPPAVSGEHPTLTEIPTFVPEPDWKTRAQALELALKWALRFVRMPDGLDAEDFAARYTSAADLLRSRP